MGQYYKAISINSKIFLDAHSHRGEEDNFNGVKLMEHSYIGNPLTAAVEHLIKEGGAWYGHRIVWSGDYADTERERAIREQEEHIYLDKGFNPEDYEDKNLYDLIGDELKTSVKKQKRDNKLRYLINLDKKEYVDINKVPKNGWGYRIHPLPILTCEGNGRGGGDLRVKSDLIGSWARNRVTIQEKKPEGMKKIVFDIVED